MPHVLCPRGHRRHTSPSQAQRQAKSQAAGVLPSVSMGAPQRDGGCGVRPIGRAWPWWWPLALAAVGLVGGVHPCWRSCPDLGRAVWPRHWGHGRGVVRWCRVLCPDLLGVSCPAWGRMAGAGSGGGRAGSTVIQQHHASTGGHRAPGRSCRAWWCDASSTPVPGARQPLSPTATGGGGLRRPGWCPRGWRRSVTGKPGYRRRSPATQQGFAGDAQEPPLVPRSDYWARLKPGVRLQRRR